MSCFWQSLGQRFAPGEAKKEILPLLPSLVGLSVNSPPELWLSNRIPTSPLERNQRQRCASELTYLSISTANRRMGSTAWQKSTMCAGHRLLTPSRCSLICLIGKGSKGEVMEKNHRANDGITTGASNAASLRLPSPQGVLGAFGFEVGLILALVQTHDTSFGRSSELDQSLGS